MLVIAAAHRSAAVGKSVYIDYAKGWTEKALAINVEVFHFSRPSFFLRCNDNERPSLPSCASGFEQIVPPGSQLRGEHRTVNRYLTVLGKLTPAIKIHDYETLRL